LIFDKYSQSWEGNVTNIVKKVKIKIMMIKNFTITYLLLIITLYLNEPNLHPKIK